MYVDNYNQLKNIGELEFSCKFFLSKKEPKETSDPFAWAGKTVDEVSREVHKELQDPDGFSLKPDIVSGTCEVCGKQDVPLYRCTDCDRFVCRGCIAEISDDISLDPVSMETSYKEGAICKECESCGED